MLAHSDCVLIALGDCLFSRLASFITKFVLIIVMIDDNPDVDEQYKDDSNSKAVEHNLF